MFTFRYDAAMRLIRDWKWYAALAVFSLFTAYIVCLPRPTSRSVDTSAPPTPNVVPAVLPLARPDPTPAEYDAMLRYTVQEGDTATSIARLFAISEEDLRWANHVSDGSDLAVGVMIWIPAQ